MIISFFNQKGGVGKTACSILLGDYIIHKLGKKVLYIDLDPQSSLSNTFLDQKTLTLTDFFMNKVSVRDVLTEIDENRFILPASISMFKVADLDSTLLVSYRNKIQTVAKNFDFVIVDCPPSLSMYSRLGLMLADRLFMPVESSDESYKAINDAIETTRALTIFNPNLEDFKVFEARSQKNRSIDEHYRGIFKDELGDKWIDISVPQVASYKERSSQGFNFFEKIDKPEMTFFFENLFNKEIIRHG